MPGNAHGWSAEQVVDLLDKTDLFEGLPHDDLSRLAAIVDGRTAQAEEVLFQEGEPGDAFYVVFDGAVELARTRPDGRRETLAVRRAGEAFGEIALLDEAPRAASARVLESTRLMVITRDGFEKLLGGDSLALRVTRAVSKALRALGPGFASVEAMREPGGAARTHAYAVSRAMQEGILPRTAPKMDGYEVAAGTTAVESGRGASIWDWFDMGDGRVALLTMDVRQDGLPAAYHLGAARTVLHAFATGGLSLAELLARTNDALASTAVEGLDQFVEVGILATTARGIEWASAGRVPGGIIRRDGSFQEFVAHGPPLGMMGGFKYGVQDFDVNVGDTVFVLSHASQGLFLGAADLVAQLHGKPAGEVVGTLHKAIRKAQGDSRTETSVLYARKH